MRFINCPAFLLFHRVKGGVKDVAVNVVMRIGNTVDRAAHHVNEGRIDHVARCAVLMAPASLLISPSNPSFHPGLDINYRLPERLIDHPFDAPVAAQREADRDRLWNRIAEIVACRPFVLFPDREVFSRSGHFVGRPREKYLAGHLAFQAKPLCSVPAPGP